MSSEDLDHALALINAEGWNYARVELERMLKLDPEGSFIYDAEVPLGVITSVSYGRTGVIGHVVVSKKVRGKKIGQSLVKATIDYLDDIGTESILLFATPDGVKLYERFGFVKKRQALCIFARVPMYPPATVSNHVSRLEQKDLPEIVALDHEIFGDDRSKLIRLLSEEFPEHAFKIVRDGKISGFVLARRTPVGFDLGPWISASGHPEDAKDLLRAVTSSLSPGSMFLGVFPDNPHAFRISQELEKERSWVTEFMIRGESRYHSGIDKVFGVSGFELG